MAHIPVIETVSHGEEHDFFNTHMVRKPPTALLGFHHNYVVALQNSQGMDPRHLDGTRTSFGYPISTRLSNRIALAKSVGV